MGAAAFDALFWSGAFSCTGVLSGVVSDGVVISAPFRR
jgi:hypothetical protein